MLQKKKAPDFAPVVINQVNNTSAIWQARADGTDMHELLPGWSRPPSECCGTWTSDGKCYIFQSTREGASNLWIMPDRTDWWKKVSPEPVQVTTGPVQFGSPIPSKDGKKLFVIGVQPRAELARYDSKAADFVPYLGGISAADVEFSHDGQWVTYVSIPDYTLWRSKADGSARFQLTYPPMRAALAHWSPDGQQIAFSGAMPGKPWKVYLISREGGSPQAITPDEVRELDPTWSPDGNTLAFGRVDPFQSDQTFIVLLDLKTRKISQLPDSKGIFAPRWSPNGRYMLAISYGNGKLLLYDVKNQKSARWKCLEFDTAEAAVPGVRAHLFSSAGQFVNRPIDVDFVRSAACRFRRWCRYLGWFRAEAAPRLAAKARRAWTSRAISSGQELQGDKTPRSVSSAL